MEERKRIIYIILIMSALVLCGSIFSNILLYRTSIEKTKDHLSDTAKILAHGIESRALSAPEGAAQPLLYKRHGPFAESVMGAIRNYERHNRKMEITVAFREGDAIHYIAALRHRDRTGHPPVVGMRSGLAEPMRRALEGKSGTMIGKDYHGNTVLAAYEFIPGLAMGVVVKIAIADIRAPYIRSGIIVIAVSLLIIFIGVVAIGRIGNPILVKLESKVADLAAANEELDAANEELQASMEEMEKTNRELYRSEFELAMSEARFRTLVERSSIGIVAVDRESGRFIFANPSACEMFGYGCEEMLAIRVGDIPSAEELERVLAGFSGVTEHENRISRELQCARKDGAAFYADITAVPILMDDIHCILAQFIDVTGRKRAEEALRESEERYRRITESITDYIFSVTIEGGRPAGTVHGNACLSVTGYSALDLNEDPYLWITMVHPDDRQAVRDQVENLLKYNRTESVEHRILRKDGVVRWVRNTPVPFYDDAGNLYAYDGIIVDITERRAVEEALRESEEKFAKAFMNAPMLMSITSVEDGTIIDVNNQFIEQSGFTREELIGKSTLETGYVRHGDREHYTDRVRMYGVASGIDLMVYPKGGGTRQVIFCGDHITIGGKELLLATAVDITEQFRISEELRREKETAQQYLDIAGVMFVAIDTGQKISLINRRGCEILGYSYEAIMGKNWFDTFFHERISEEMRDVFNQLVRGEIVSVENYENAVVTASGEERLMAWHNTIIRDASGTITGTLSSGEDITERRKSEDELHGQLAVNMALAGISGSIISRSFTITETAYMVLEYARILSDSEHGFVAEIDPDTGNGIGHALTGMYGAPASRGQAGPILVKIDSDGRYPGLIGHALNTRREFFTNDPVSHPASGDGPGGGAPPSRFLSVPVIYGGDLVGQIALADSTRDYTEEDLKMARRLGSIYAMAVVRIRNDARLLKSLEEKTVLIKELHHRVKNNMQVVSSLISLQSRKIDDDRYRDIFMESSNRIQAMAMVHEKIYHSEDLARVDFSRYVREIAERLLSSFSLERGQVVLDIDVRDVFLGIDEAVPCGIILNELITNSFKHAFPKGRRGKLSITFVTDGDGRHRLVVQDDGPGIPDDLIGSADKSLGMQIVTALTRQLNGTISADSAGGARIEIVF